MYIDIYIDIYIEIYIYTFIFDVSYIPYKIFENKQMTHMTNVLPGKDLLLGIEGLG